MTSLALTFLGGAPFQLLYEGVKIAIRKSNKFRTHLENLEMTLGCLQPWIIQQIRANNVQLNLPNNLIQDLEIKMEEGKELVYKLSRLGIWNIRVWGNCYNCIKPNYADQLAELDRSLRLLLEILKLEEMRNVQENLLLARNHSDKQDDLDKKMSELLKVHQEVLKAQKEMFDMMRVQHEAVHEAMQRIRADAVQNVQGETAPAPAPALRIVFWVLYDVVIQVKVKNIMCKRLLQEFKSTLDFLKPLIEEMAESNKLLHLPEQEQEKFIIQMREGVELIDKCSKVSKWHSYKKYACTNKLLKLDESLRGLFHKMSMQIAIHVKEGLISISSMEAMIKKIEESGVIQNQSQVVLTKPQPPLHEAGLDVLDTHGSKDVEGTGDDLNEKEVGVKQIGRDGTRQNEKEIEGLSEVPENSSPKTTLDVQGTKDINESLDSESVHIAQTKQSQGTRMVEAPVAESYKFPFLMVESDVYLRELKKKIFEDQVAMLVITGPAGCGKTTLARMFCEDQEVKMKFKNIFFVHVSENPSLDFIVQQLYEQKDSVVLELQEDAVNWLQQFLKETGGDPSLLVLDDVWSGSESLLDKFDGLRTSMHKILVTSRSEFPRFDCYLENLKSLDDEEEMAHLKGKVVAAVRATGDYPERVGKPICEYYLKTGTCKFGPSCKFHHPKQGIGYLSSLYGLTQLSSPTHALERPYTSVVPSSVGPSSSSPNEQAFPERPREPECQYYLRTGDYKFVPSCRYHHPRDQIAPRTNCLLSPVGLLGNSGSNAWPSFSQVSLSMEDFQTSLDLKLNAQHSLLQTPMSPCVSISRRISSNDKSSQSDVEDKSELDEIQSQISGVTVPESLHDPLESKDQCPMNVNNTLEYAASGTTPNSVNVDGQSVTCNSIGEIGSISQKQGVKEKVAFRTKSEIEILDDGFKWRKYGKKFGKNSTNPRNYYKCAYEGCPVKKRVERDGQDPSYVITCYNGVHNHTSLGKRTQRVPASHPQPLPFPLPIGKEESFTFDHLADDNQEESVLFDHLADHIQ